MSHKERKCISCNKLCQFDVTKDTFKCTDCGNKNRILINDKCLKCGKWFELYADELDYVWECNRCYFDVPNFGQYMKKNANV